MAGKDKRLLYTIVLAAIAVVIVTLVVLFKFSQQRAQRASCQNTMKDVYFSCERFAAQSEGEVWPRLSSEPGVLMMDNTQPAVAAGSLHPQFLGNLEYLTCDTAEIVPMSVETAFDDASYWYVGYAFTDQDELESFRDAYLTAIEQGTGFDDDLPVEAGTGSGGFDELLRLRTPTIVHIDPQPPVSKYFQDNEANIPVMVERVDVEGKGRHRPKGGNVLFMDGHVEYVEYGTWPYTPEAIAVFLELDGITR